MKRRESDLPIQQIKQPIERLTHLENISGIALIGGALVALVLANSPLGDAVASFWKQHLVVAVGPFEVDESLGHWVNDALMAIFFLVAGLEIKRELVVGELREPRKAALPVVAAIGGMIVPALLYVAIAGADVRGGWGVPMATDIAFAVGVISLLGNRIPSKLKLMLLTLAIVDDLGAIVVIAVFYTASLNMTALFVALGLLGAMAALRLLGVWWMPIYALVGVGPWFALLESGVHAPLAGVACGLLAPALPRRSHETTVIASSHHTVDELKEIVFDTRESRSVVDRLSHNLHPFSALPIVPIFAMANTAVTVSPSALADAATSSVSQAIVVGLVLGKPIGIVLASWHPGILASWHPGILASWLAVRSGLAVLPTGVTWTHIAGMGSLAGIGFTVSLFVTQLAFDSDEVIANAKLGVLAASILASVVGVVLLRRATADQPLGPITFEEFDATGSEPILAGAGHAAGAVSLDN
ncbi:MAG: Na+/H+ antiporter NhaA [Actinomycetota bacterium]|nr:Na+/H+ antiporter NhaA [Actinomycetota bacterium]